MTLTPTQATIAKQIRSDNRAWFECIGVGIDFDQGSALESKAMQARNLGRYLAQHMVGLNRAEFLRACGLRNGV